MTETAFAREMSRAAAQAAAGDTAAAETLYRRMLAQAPDFHPAYHAWGLLALGAGQLPLAVALVDRAVTLAPNVGVYLRNLCEMNRRMGLLPQAIAVGERAVSQAADDFHCHYNLGLALTDAERLSDALVCYRAALAINPEHGLSWNNLGAALERLEERESAAEAYARAVSINPAHAEAQNNLGALHSEQGELSEAAACFNAAITANPVFVEAHHNLSQLKKYTLDDPHLQQLESMLDKVEQLSIPARIRYNFALGKALEDTENFDRAFKAYAEGNRLQFGLMQRDESVDVKRVQQVKSHFTAATLSQQEPGHGDDSRIPVFIVGMPRSGTTLIEQVLSSHPDLQGAGELSDLNQVIQQAASAVGKPFPECIEALSEQQLAAMGREYLDRVWQRSPGARYITDKMPANFFYIGMIRRMLPQAKIIHAMRDPMDSCLSNYTRHFKQTMDFAYDLGTLGRYYVRYIELMRHWQQVLPAGSILDVRYEQTVANFESQARDILDYVGLPWNDEVLRFYENKRLVKTASVAQVRKPIYASSVARWQHYGDRLQPLLDIVKDYR